jgi:hypothetical protein
VPISSLAYEAAGDRIVRIVALTTFRIFPAPPAITSASTN